MKKIIVICLLMVCSIITACQSEQEKTEPQIKVEKKDEGGWGLESKNDPF